MNKKTIFITGSSGYIGEMLVDQFSKREDVEKIIGLDIVKPTDLTANNPKLVFINANLGDFDWQDRVASYKPEIVINTAWQIRELKDKQMQYKLNIQASENIFEFCFNNNFVDKLIHYSTVSSYGAFKENEIDKLFTEEDPFRESSYFYAEEKRIAEKKLKNKFEENKSLGLRVPKVFIIRPSSITGPRGRYMRTKFGLQSVLSGQLKNSKSIWYALISSLVSVMPIAPKWCRQFVHEDDINNVTELLSFGETQADYEIFNITPPGPVVLGKDMAKAVNKKYITLHPRIIQFAFFIIRNLSFGRIPTSKGGWKTYSYPIVVDGSKISKKYNYQYKMNSFDAFTKIEGRYKEFAPKN